MVTWIFGGTMKLTCAPELSPYGMILGRLMRQEAGITSNDLPNGWGDYIVHDAKVSTSW